VENDLKNLSMLWERLYKLTTGYKPHGQSFTDEGQLMDELMELIEKLSDNLKELNTFTNKLAQGNLDADPPGRSNYLAGHIKGLHGRLLHLTWQTQQVAKGDYSQSVDFMGAFSDAFNHMVKTLEERETSLKDEIDLKNNALQALENSKNLLEAVLSTITDIVVVTHDSHILYSNSIARKEFGLTEDEKLPVHKEDNALFKAILKTNNNDSQQPFFEIFDPNRKKYYLIKTFPILWKDEKGARLQIAVDITETKNKEKELAEFANYDELTGIPNRRAGLTHFDDTLKNYTAYPICLCYIDLDNLKSVNDNYGHAYGDAYIKLTTKIIKGSIRSNDFVSRMGGDEFIIIFTNATKENITPVLERMLQKLVKIKELDGQTIPFTLSFSYGITEISEQESKEAQEYLHMADELMYGLKKKKKNPARN